MSRKRLFTVFSSTEIENLSSETAARPKPVMDRIVSNLHKLRLVGKLQLIEPFICAAQLEQLIMSAGFDDASLFHYNYLIGHTDRRQTMCDDDRRTVLH